MNPQIVTNETDSIEEEILVPEIIRLIDKDIDPSLFVPLSTGKEIDHLYSKKQGIMPGTVNMICGEPGVGKTTVSLDILICLQRNYPDKSFLYIPSEMNETDMYEEALDNPSLLNVPTLFINKYVDNGLDKIIEATFAQNHTAILLDSFVDIMEKVADEKCWSMKKAEMWLLNLMLKTAETRFTTFFCIQQFTKGGNFVGSNKLKHNTTSFMFILRDKTHLPYIIFHKNRRNGVQVMKNLYFTKSKKTGEILYDWKRFEKDESILSKVALERAKIAEESIDFDKLFENHIYSPDEQQELDIDNNKEIIETTELIQG